MLKRRLTEGAKQDLINIRSYTKKEWGIMQQEKYLLEMNNSIKLLQESPLIGKAKPDLGNHFYSYPFKSHVIYYSFNSKLLMIFGIIHKSMIPTKHLAKDDKLFQKK